MPCARQPAVVSIRGCVKALRENLVAVVTPLGPDRVGRDVGSVCNAPADGLQPGEGSLFDDGLGEGAQCAGPPTSDERCPRHPNAP